MLEEICICAAIKMPDGYIVRGHRHCDAILTANGIRRYDRKDIIASVQGFVTSNNRFVDRVEGAQLMRNADWHNPITGLFFTDDILFSEDLY